MQRIERHDQPRNTVLVVFTHRQIRKEAERICMGNQRRGLFELS
jgi:hypothetical protein